MNIAQLGLPENIARKILLSIKWRRDKYGIIGISRTEWKKFWISEWQMRKFLDKCKKIGLLSKVKEKQIGKYSCNIYSVSNMIEQVSAYIKDLNKKIVEWIRNVNPSDVLRHFGNKVNLNYRLNDKKYITFHKHKWIVANWKEHKIQNLFNYLKEQKEMDAYSFARLVWIK